MDGVRLLRRRRGSEQVMFDDIADHLVDYADRHPDACGTIDRLARFLAEIERVPHDHRASPERGVAGTPEWQLPQV